MASMSAVLGKPDTDVVSAESFVSPYQELIALECLYAEEGSSLRKITQATVLSGKLPSAALRERDGLFGNPERDATVKTVIDQKIGGFSVAINGTPAWPDKLQDSERPTPLLYYRGDINLIDMPSVSIVGARQASGKGLARAARLAMELARNGKAVVTGLARGIDTAATKSAIEAGGVAIGVIGTPIDEYYPPENQKLQDMVSRDYLLVSQVPFYRYQTEPFKAHKYHFPERNELMAAISDATVIVEASDRSGTLSQANACLKQGRPLFIMRSAAESTSISWPAKYLGKEGVSVLDDTAQLLEVLDGHHG